MRLEQLENMIHDFRADQNPVAFFTAEHGNGNAPCPLPGDAPVRPVFDHAVNTVPSPAGDPFHPVDFFQSLFSEPGLVHGNKPLGRCPENNGFFTSPAVGIGMLQRFLFHQAARFPQFFNDRGIGFEHELSGKKVHLRGETSVVIDRGIGLQSVLHADLIVFAAMPGRRMHAPGAGLKGHMISQNHQRIPLIERVTAFQVFQSAGSNFTQNRVI